MQSDQRWLKKLANSTFKNGKWTTSSSPSQNENPFQLLQDDVEEAVFIYNQNCNQNSNQNTSKPIRMLNIDYNSNLIVALLCGSSQLKMTKNGSFLDISMIRVCDFQTIEQPMSRLTPMLDVFGYPVWKRGTTELSTDQLIRTSLIHLIEAST